MPFGVGGGFSVINARKVDALAVFLVLVGTGPDVTAGPVRARSLDNVKLLGDLNYRIWPAGGRGHMPEAFLHPVAFSTVKPRRLLGRRFTRFIIRGLSVHAITKVVSVRACVCLCVRACVEFGLAET